jgi:hypothetical protein
VRCVGVFLQRTGGLARNARRQRPLRAARACLATAYARHCVAPSVSVGHVGGGGGILELTPCPRPKVFYEDLRQLLGAIRAHVGE